MTTFIASASISHKRLFNWVTELSKCNSEDKILLELGKIQKDFASYEALVKWSNTSFITGNYLDDLPLFRGQPSPITDDEEYLPHPEPPEPSESEGSEPSEAGSVEAGSEPSEAEVPPKKKRKVYDKNDFTKVQKFLEENYEKTKFEIIDITTHKCAGDLYNDIKVQLSKCSNFVGDTNEARYIIGCHLSILTEYSNTSKGEAKITAEFFKKIEEQLKISKRYFARSFKISPNKTFYTIIQKYY